MWKTAACETTGRLHKINDIPCQDKTQVYMSDNINIIALSDGAGSARLSHYGAECTVNALCEYISEHFDELYNMENAIDAKTAVVSEMLSAISKESLLRGCKIDELACTLLFVAVNDERFLLGHIGDGVICFSKGGQAYVASKPDNGEYANQTYFVTTNGTENRMRLMKGILEDVDGFAIMSDGTSASLYNPRKEKMSEAALSMINLCRELPAKYMSDNLQKSMDTLIALRTHDDCSVAIMAKAGTAGINNVRKDIQCDLLGIKEDPLQNKRLEFYNTILTVLDRPKTLVMLSREVHLKEKYLKRRMRKLEEAGLVMLKGNKYHRG